MPQFKSPDHLVRHFSDHVLMPNESNAWALLFDGLVEFAFLSDSDVSADRCYQRRQELSRGDLTGPLVRMLAEYQVCACEGFLQSRNLEWGLRRADEWLGMNLNGLIVVAIMKESGLPMFKTAYLAGHGTPEGIRLAKGSDSDFHARVPKDPRGRGMRESRRTLVDSDREAKRKQHIRASWTSEQRIYHECFLPSLAFVMSRQFNESVGELRTHAPILAELKTILPRKKQIPFEVWVQKRQEQERSL